MIRVWGQRQRQHKLWFGWGVSWSRLCIWPSFNFSKKYANFKLSLWDVGCHQQTPTTSSAKKLFKSPPKKRRCSTIELTHFGEKLLELETIKVKYFEYKITCTQDGDYQCLMSLLPYLNDIPKQRKLFVRQKMIRCVMEEFQKHDLLLPHIVCQILLLMIPPHFTNSMVNTSSCFDHFYSTWMWLLAFLPPWL